jgi:hypothetical protein
MFTNQQLMVIAGLSAIAALVIYDKTKKAATAGIDAIPPTNPDNIFYSGVNNIGASLTGQENFSLGVWLYDITH